MKLDDDGDVVRIRWGVFDTAETRWRLPPREADVDELIDALMKGDLVASRKPSGAPGAELRTDLSKTHVGKESIATADSSAQPFTVADFDQF